MTKKKSRDVLDRKLSAALIAGDAPTFMALYDFAFFTDLITGKELKALHRVWLYVLLEEKCYGL